MSEQQKPPAAGSAEGAEKPEHSEPGAPATGPIRTVGQRRRDAESKLEQHQQEARDKTAHEKGQDTA